ncbi:hypothetical protein [Erythrobacter aureus]|uniref:Tetratricopeptide repeat protein n=1 Tax=Erythrobacter aureus TaxID=2182384 RepID=A0A345YJN4_9SPHN|nr:hypothetical protein [Erythrobacter aureus]AXK44136.1 hypothetical protein DVR09_16930 [Erythrobacter aureus]
MIDGGDAWAKTDYYEALASISKSNAQNRQAARWVYASSLVGREEFSEALGVLTVMGQDDPDLELVPAYQLAIGASLTGLGRTSEALKALSGESLIRNPEACAWRMRALGEAGFASDALIQWGCAKTAVSDRSAKDRTPFLHAIAKAALISDKPAKALKLVNSLPDSDPAANLLRGQAHLDLGQEQEARLRLKRVADNGSPLQTANAELTMLEWRADQKRGTPQQLLEKLDQISFGWRGGELEERALRLRYKLAGDISDDHASLEAGATILRYFPEAGGGAEILTSLQRRLSEALDPESDTPLPEAAGLFWDYRDLAPAGATGDLMVNQLADRLQTARLYKRAAELLNYQLTTRLKDEAQGPTSVRVARLYILAGNPDQALEAIRATGRNVYPNETRWARRRVEAVALNHLGKTEEALAALEDVPSSEGIRSEIEWRRRNWKALADDGVIALPKAKTLSAIDQTLVLRHAVSLAMLGREEDLGKLRARYQASFKNASTAPAFDLLTSPVSDLKPNAVAEAMASIPTASPAGDLADLIATDPVVARKASS